MHVVKVYYQEHKAKLWNYSVASLDLWGHIALNFLHKFPHLTQKKKVWLQRTIASNYKLHSNRIKCVHHLCLYLLICLYFMCITYRLYNLMVSHLSTLRLIDWTKAISLGRLYLFLNQVHAGHSLAYYTRFLKIDPVCIISMSVCVCACVCVCVCMCPLPRLLITS